MAITIYSQSFKREIDIEQLLFLRGHTEQVDINTKIKKLSISEKTKISQDVLCPICHSQGGEIISASKSNQSHFRFESHEYFCDYNKSKQIKGQKGKIVDFSDSRSNQTKIIRELVAKGIEQKIISQQVISDMRKYFYETKVKHQYTMDISINALNWFQILIYHKHISLEVSNIKFNPSYAQIPNFNWRLAAEDLFRNENKNLIEKVTNDSYILPQKLLFQVRNTIENTQNSLVFDVKELRIPYQNTIILSKFIVVNFAIKDSKGKDLTSSDIVLAFAALLLYISEWNIELAISNLIKIVTSPDPVDINSGNIIGLNPFYNFEMWDIISKIKEVSNYSTNGFDYTKQIKCIQQQLESKYKGSE